MRHHHDRARGHIVRLPQAEQFLAQIGGCQHIQGAERFVHEEQFRLDHERTREADTLAHAAGKFFGIGIFEPVQADHIDGGQGAFQALRTGDLLCASRPSSTFCKTVSQGKRAND